MNRKIKVLHILWSGRSGGAQRFVRDIVKYSDKEKFGHAVCFLFEGGAAAEDISRLGVSVYYLGMKSGLSLLAGMRFIGIVNKVKPDIINNHIRNYFVNMLMLFFPKIYKVYFEHGGDLIGGNPARDIMFYRLFGRFYDIIFANSGNVKEKIAEVSKSVASKVKIFYIGIDTEEYKCNIDKAVLKAKIGIPPENKVIGVVARLVKEKGVGDFIKVASENNKLRSGCSFVIIGDGDMRTDLEEEAQRSGASVNFLGDRQDVPALLNIFDIYLFTSRVESFGVAVLEAMAAGIPVAGFELPGVKEIFDSGGGDLLLNGRNHEKLAETVIKLLGDEKEYCRLSEEGRKNVENNFNIKNNIKKMEEAYVTGVSPR